MRQRFFGVLVGGVLVLGLAACIQAPTLTARSAQLQRLNLQGLTVLVDLDLNNPNDVDLPIQKVVWDLTLAQRPFSNGQVPLSAALTAGQTTQVQVPIAIAHTQGLATVSDIIRGRNIPYLFRGQVYFNTPVGVLDTPFTIQGEWDNPLTSLEPQPVRRAQAQVDIPRI
ncbi:MAG: LEA type 2 family protein [Myxococcota bacterium]